MTKENNKQPNVETTTVPGNSAPIDRRKIKDQSAGTMGKLAGKLAEKISRKKRREGNNFL